jgi:hypothetical protein
MCVFSPFALRLCVLMYFRPYFRPPRTRMTQLHSRGTLAHNHRTCLFKDLHRHRSDPEAPWPLRTPRPRGPRDIMAFPCPLSDHRSKRSQKSRTDRIASSFFPPFFFSLCSVSFFVRVLYCSHREGLVEIHDRDVLTSFLDADSTHTGPCCMSNGRLHEQNLANYNKMAWSAKRPRPLSLYHVLPIRCYGMGQPGSSRHTGYTAPVTRPSLRCSHAAQST